MDETAAEADLILPDRHFLESWGDTASRPGQWAVQQPAMRPVPHFDSKQTGDVLLSVATQMGQNLGAPSFYEYLRGRWGDLAVSAGAAAWLMAGTGATNGAANKSAPMITIASGRSFIARNLPL